jgi:photosystem II stability/assembly factor-like uncharacterized protein
MPTFSPLPVSAEFNDLKAVSGGSAWVFLRTTGGESLVYGTSDGGLSWRTIAIPTEASNNKEGIQLVDEIHGFVQHGRGLLATADGGRNWRPVPLPPGYTFGLGARFVTPSRGWYQDLEAYPDQAAQPSSMWWTSNAGASWSLLWRVTADQPAAGAIPLDGTKYVLGFDGSLGWLTLRVGSSHRLLQTADGGHTWAEATVPVSEAVLLYSVVSLPGDSAILLARGGSHWWAIRSRDGGRTWADGRPIPVSVPDNSGAYDRPAFIDLEHWMLAGGTVIHATSDGGRTWHDVHPKLPVGIFALHDLWLFPGGKGWATGSDAVRGGSLHVLVTADDGATWSLSPVPHL